jgi:hypothetical protein
MKSSFKRTATPALMTTVQRILVLCLVLAPLCIAAGQQAKNGAAKGVNGRYEGSAKNAAGDIITVAFELSEKDGAMSGMIRSDHGDFTITGGSHKGEDVRLEFDANGSSGTIVLKLAEDKLAGTWSAGDDGGSVEVKKAAQEAPKEKS